jgi:MFS family permease
MSGGGLWRHRDFRRLWIGDSLSQFGTRIGVLAVPLVAISTLHATTFQVGLLVALESAAFLVIGLPAGAWCDRMRRRPVLITADLVRAVLLLSIPAAALADRLTLAHLYAVVTCHGVATVFFDVSYQSYLPALVGRRHLVEGNGKLEASRTVALAAGPAAGGYLVQWLTAPVALAADAVTFLWSALWLARIRTVEPVPDRARRAPLRTEIAEGVRFVFRHPVLRAITLQGATAVLFLSASQAVLLVFLVREIGLAAGTVGLLMTIGSAGAVAGALVTTRLTRRLGQARSMIAYVAIASLAEFMIPLTAPGWRLGFFVVANTIVAALIVAFNIVQVSYRQTICPDHLLGRMNATMRFVMWGMTPVGAVLGGALGTAVGARNTLWITAMGLVLPVLWVVFSPVGPAAWRGEELTQTVGLEQAGGLGQGADANQAQDVRVGAGPVDGAGLGQGIPVAAQQSQHRPGVPGQRDDVDVAAGGAKRLADGRGVLIDGGHQAGVAHGGDKTVDTDAGHELVEDGVGGENPG